MEHRLINSVSTADSESARLHQVLVWLSIVLSGLIPFDLLIYLTLGYQSFLYHSGVMVVVVSLLILALRLKRQGHLRGAILTIGTGFYIGMFMLVLIIPSLTTTSIIASVMLIALLLPYLKRRQLLITSVVEGVLGVVLFLLGTLLPPRVDPLPPLVANLYGALGVGLSLIVTLLTLWQYHGRIQEQIDRLEQRVAERTEDLRQARDEAEQARKAADAANTAKSTFLANMSHELRSPLNAIINFTRFLDKPRYGPLTPRQQELQGRVLANAYHLLGLINDILDLSKIESGKLELNVTPVDLHPTLRGVLDTATGLIKDKPITLIADLTEALPPALADVVRVRQVLLNLLSNAAKFTEHGSITLRARTAGAMLELAVIDTGIGIAPEHQELIFEEFRQVADSFNRQQQGTGLGLSICRRLVELHGGRIWLESSAGVGSIFAFTLPLASASTHALPDEQPVPEKA